LTYSIRRYTFALILIKQEVQTRKITIIGLVIVAITTIFIASSQSTKNESDELIDICTKENIEIYDVAFEYNCALQEEVRIYNENPEGAIDLCMHYAFNDNYKINDPHGRKNCKGIIESEIKEPSIQFPNLELKDKYPYSKVNVLSIDFLMEDADVEAFISNPDTQKHVIFYIKGVSCTDNLYDGCSVFSKTAYQLNDEYVIHQYGSIFQNDFRGPFKMGDDSFDTINL